MMKKARAVITHDKHVVSEPPGHPRQQMAARWACLAKPDNMVPMAKAWYSFEKNHNFTGT
jgi:hypothetical protein